MPVLDREFYIADLLVQPHLDLVSRNGLAIHLEPKIMQVLLCLAENQGEVVSKERLITTIWTDTFVSDQVLSNAIWKLRLAFNDHSKQSQVIETIPKRGYRLLSPVKQVPLPSHPDAQPVPKSRKWIASVIVVCAVVLVTITAISIRNRMLPPHQLPVTPVIAVLPFENLSGDDSHTYLADGIQDELITELAQIKSLRVISRTSTIRFRNTKLSMPEAGRTLGANLLVEGSLHRSNDEIRVTVQLIDSTKDVHVWAKSYQRPIKDFVTLNSEIAAAIAEALRIDTTLVTQRRKRLANVSYPGYDAYLRGNEMLHQLHFAEAEQLYKKALETDPDFPEAYVGLAFAYAELSGWFSKYPPGTYRDRAREAAQHAIDLDPQLADAHAVLGWIRFVYDWDWAGAHQAFERAAALGINSPWARIAYANYLAAVERHEESVRYSLESTEISPLDRDVLQEMLIPLVALGRIEEARAVFKRSVGPGRAPLMLCPQVFIPDSAAVYVSIADEMLAHSGCSRSAACKTCAAELLGKAGQKERGNVILRDVEMIANERYVSRGAMARAYMAVGDRHNALIWLNRGIRDKDPSMVWVKTRFNPLAADPEFRAVLRKMNLAN